MHKSFFPFQKKPPKFKKLPPQLILTEFKNQEIAKNYPFKYFDSKEIENLNQKILYLVPSFDNEHSSSCLEFKCVVLNLFVKFNTLQMKWIVYKDNLEIEWSEYANMCLKKLHFCCPYKEILSNLFQKQQVQILKENHPIDKYAQILLLLNLNYIASFQNSSRNTQQKNNGNIISKFENYQKYPLDVLLWNKNCVVVNEKIIIKCKKINFFEWENEEIFSLLLTGIKSEDNMTLERFASSYNIQDFFLDFSNLLLAFNDIENIFQYQPSRFAFWRYAFSLHIIKFFISRKTKENCKKFISNLRTSFGFDSGFAALIDEIWKILESKGNEHAFVLVKTLNRYLDTFFNIDEFLDVIYILYKNSYHELQYFSLIANENTYEIYEELYNPIFKCLKHLFNSNNHTLQSFFSQTIPPKIRIEDLDISMTYSINITNLFINNHMEELCKFISENKTNLMNLGNHNTNINFFRHFSRFPITNICSYVNLLICVYINLMNIHDYIFEFILHNLEQAYFIAKYHWLFLIMLLQPFSKKQEEIVCVYLAKEKNFFLPRTVNYSKKNFNEILDDNSIQYSFLIDCSDGDRKTIEYYVIE